MRVCPLCEKNDSITNIAAIVAQGTQRSEGTTHSRGLGYGRYGTWLVTRNRHTHQSTSQSDLAGALDFPTEREPGPAHRVVGLGLALAGVGGLYSDELAALLLYLLLPGVLLSSALFIVVWAFNTVGGFRILMGAVVAHVAFGVGVYLLYQGPFGYMELPVALRSVFMMLALVAGVAVMIRGGLVRLAFRRAAPERQRARRIWQGLYYCSRDHVVFDPGSGRFGPPGALRELLYPR